MIDLRDTDNMDDKVEKFKWRNAVTVHMGITFVMLIVTLMLERYLLRGLSIYQTGIGSFLLIRDLIMQAAGLVIWSVAAVTVIALVTKYKNISSWIVHYFVISALYSISLVRNLNEGLANDVSFTWIMNKAGLDMLSLRYLNGMTIATIFVLTGLFLLSNLQIKFARGKDGNRDFYIRSKVLGIARIFYTPKKGRIGKNLDFPMLVEDRGEERSEVVKWNDYVRIYSKEFATLTAMKILLGFAVASVIADKLTLRFIVVQNYVATSGGSWIGLAQNYLSIFWMRIMGSIATPPDFAIVNLPTFELYRLFETGLYWFLAIWGIRCAIAIIGEVLTILEMEDSSNIYNKAYSKMNILKNFFMIGMLWKIPEITAIGTEVFDAATPFYKWQTIVYFIFFATMVFVCKFLAKNPEMAENLEDRFVEWFKEDLTNRFKTLGVVVAIFLLLLTPVWLELALVNPFIQGRGEEYSWQPAIYPSVLYTQNAYDVGGIQRTNISAMTFSGKEVFLTNRIFNDAAAKLNMKSKIGNNNWLSSDPSDADIVLRNNREFWVIVATLVGPPYPNDPDTWRAWHTRLVLSEKVVAIDAATSEEANISEVFGMKGIPQIRYGEGGLWRDVNEVYTGIPKINETHIPEYQGPQSYNGEPDYVYKAFWRQLKFYTERRFDFAGGDYGDIKALVDRDISRRVSKILLPGMKQESDIYPVWDNNGNMYALVWITIDWKSPTKFGGFPEQDETQIIRKFGVVLVSYEDGSFLDDGYLFNNQKDDYILSTYRSFYPSWKKSMPDWLKPQLRYPEEFMSEQIRVYNEAFQTDYSKYLGNRFYEPTLDSKGNSIEEIRYIMLPFYGKLTWVAERLVEPYQADTRNLAGTYVFPGGNQTGEQYFVDFGTENIIGPATALEAVDSIQELTAYAGFTSKKWIPGNILMYSGKRQYYVIPYFAESASTLVPQMVAVIDAQSRAGGAYIIKQPTDYREVSMATVYAFEKIGVSVSPEIANAIGEAIHKGLVVAKNDYAQNGNTRWLIDIQENNSVSGLLAKAETLNLEEIKKILHLEIGGNATIRTDLNGTVVSVN